MSWIEIKYINLLSNRLRNFKRKSSNLYNFSCPICGDSEIKKSKARGYIYNKDNKLIYHCHNCNITLNFDKFLKTIDISLYNEFNIDKIKEFKTSKIEENEYAFKIPEYIRTGILKGLKKVSQVSSNHPVKKFVDSRKIPNPYHAKLFVCPNFMNFTNNIIPNKFSENALKFDETRLLIPFINKNNIVHAFQGRSIKKSDVKYITIITDESEPKIYGLDTVNFNKTTFVFEGPIDSMFINNSIATAGGDMISTIHKLNKNNLIIVYDNEPRSIETINKIDKAIIQGYTVCIWPQNIEHKDINDMILNNMSSEYIEHIILNNSYKDLTAKLMLKQWSKV